MAIHILIIEVAVNNQTYRRWVLDTLEELRHFIRHDPEYLSAISQVGAKPGVWDMMDKTSYLARNDIII